MTIRDYPIAIIGAGPVGMAAAAHLTSRNIPFIIFEIGKSVGASILDWGHVQLFSPWKYNIDKAAEELLKDTGWVKPDGDALPTGNDIVTKYLLPLSKHYKISSFIHLNSIVLSITKRGFHKVKSKGRDKVPFVIDVLQKGRINTYEASGVIDASGTWFNPNPIGASGTFANGESRHSEKISYRIPDILNSEKEKYANKTVAVVGAGHSAINSLLDLASLKNKYPQTKLHWILNNENLNKVYGGQEDDALEARGALGTKIRKLVESGTLKIHNPFSIKEIFSTNENLMIKGYLNEKIQTIENIDEVIANTGARPDFSMLREVRIEVDPALESVPALAELIDPNIHSCGTVRPHGEKELRQPEKNFYIVGVKSYGRAPTFLMATGYEQVRSIAAYLDEDYEAAERVELNLPETGVCGTGSDSGAACCGPAPKEEINDTGTSCCTPPQPENRNNNSNTISMKNENHLKESFETVEASGCCGGAPTTNEDACCKLDEDQKAEGETGCGCNTSSSSPATQSTAKAISCC